MKRPMFVVFSLIMVLGILLSACAPAGSAKLRVATDATYPPFESVDEKTKAIVGYDADLIKAVGTKAGLEVELINVNFDALLAGMAKCQYDAAISAVTITDDRKKEMAFSDPYINAGQIVTVKKDNATVKSKDDLKGKKIGVQISTTGAIEAEKISKDTVKTYDTVDLAFQDLMNGQIEGVIADYPTTLNFVAKSPDKMKVVGSVFTDENYGIVICKSKPELVTKINTALAALKSEGFLKKLEDQWVNK